MYTAKISRDNPAFIGILVDRSFSMSENLAGTQRTKADAVADALNGFLFNLCTACWTDQVEGPRPYLRIAALGYGLATTSDPQNATVESVFHADMLRQQPSVTPGELARNAHQMAEGESEVVDAGAIQIPTWVEPGAGYGTPMCEAMAEIGSLAAAHTNEFPRSFPPMIVNISDGMATDEPYNNASLVDWASRLQSLRTDDGQALLINVYLSEEPAPPAHFPSNRDALPLAGQRLFEISSELPEPLLPRIKREGYDPQPGAKALVVNASETSLNKLLLIGTNVVIDAMKVDGP